MNEELYNEFTTNDLDPKNKKLSLLKQELDVNLQQQTMLKNSINFIKESFKEIPNTDPDYAILFTQLEMNQIELDELKNKEENLKNQISHCS